MVGQSPTIRGQSAFWLLYLFDIAEALHLDVARRLCGAEETAGPFPSPTPAYDGFENPPVVGTLSGGPHGASRGSWKLFEYGVLCIEWEVPFEGSWADLVAQSRRFQESQAAGIREAEVHARELALRLRPALESPYESWRRSFTSLANQRW